MAAVADPRKGQRLVLVTDKRDASRGEFVERAHQRTVADLMIPSEIIHLDKLPLLGSGKPDNLAIAKLVAEHFKQEPAAAA